jgi:hypothetical protein
MKLTGENRRTRGKTCPIATLSTTNPTWTDPGSNPGLRSGKPAAEPWHGLSCQCHVDILPAYVYRYHMGRHFVVFI